MQLYIVDGSGFLFRAYYGYPELHDKDGHNINVIYGFCSMMIGLLKDKPDGFIIAWDAPQATKRKEHFSGYKANRKKTPDDLKRQIRETKELIDKLGIPAIQVPGYEADDIMATVAKSIGKDDHHVTIVSSDKDLKQLLSENISCLDTMKGMRTTAQSRVETEGYEPRYLLDYLSMLGDASDNIPGVKGIGKVTAEKLVKQYKTLEAVYEHLDELPTKTADKFVEYRDDAIMSKRLVDLMHVPGLESVTPETSQRTPDFARIEKILVTDYQLNGLKKKITQLKNHYQQPTQVGLFG